MNNTIRFLKTFSRLAVGLLFVFSGYVKAVDPQGSAIKFGEYFVSLGLDFLDPLALTFSILQSALEITIGLSLIGRLRMKLTAWAVLLFMSFFTVLTFFIAVTGNIVDDCGCFGDAVKLTNWETFIKNLILMPFTLVVFFMRRSYRPVSTGLFEWSALSVMFTFSCIIGLYSNRNLPLIDFMAYKVGTNIEKGMEIPEDAERDVYKTILIYEKDGELQEFDETNYPWEDSTWTFVDSKSKLIKQGYRPSIYDFSIASPELGTITDSILSKPSYTLILTSELLNNARTNKLKRVSQLVNFCRSRNDIDFFVFTGSNYSDAEAFSQTNSDISPIYFGDGTTIKSMVRSNPGLMLIHNGTIIAKWANANIPTTEKLEYILSEAPEQVVAETLSDEKCINSTILTLMVLLSASLNLFNRKKDEQ